jgi:hypothetical protein
MDVFLRNGWWGRGQRKARETADPSTAWLTKCASYFAPDDTVFAGVDEDKQRQKQPQLEGVV